MLKEIRNELGLGKVAGGERPMAVHIPYLRHVSDTVIKLQSGALASVIKLNGLFFQTEDQAVLNLRSTVQNTIIRGLGSSRFSVWSTVVRRQVGVDIGGAFDDPFSGYMNDRYFDGLREKRMFTNDLFLTVVRTSLRGALGFGETMNRLFGKVGGKSVELEAEREAVADLEDLVKNMVNQFRPYGARALGIAREKPLSGNVGRDEPYSEPSEFFNLVLTGGVPRKMRLPRMGIRDYVGTSRLHFANRVVHMQAATEEDSRFGAMLSIKEYPPFTGPGMLDGLLQVKREFVLTQSFTLADKPIAQERISRLQRQIQASDAGGTSVQEDIDMALNALLNQEAVFGNHHLSLMCISRDFKDVSKSVADLGAALTEMNITWLREDMNLEASFWAQLPGNHAYIARDAMLSSANFSGLSSMHNFASGQLEKLHWGTPITVFETASQSPYVFNFHQSDLGHFIVTGQSGTGKTVAMTFLFSQAGRVTPAPKGVFFDKDRGAEIFIRAQGGLYEVLQPGVKTGFNPFQLENTAINREFLLRLLKAMLRSHEGEFSQPEEETLEQAIGRLMGEPANIRNLSNFRTLLAGQRRAEAGDLQSRMKPWIEGERSWLFNADADTLDLKGTRIVGFDMTKILDNPDVRTPALMYLYHRLDELVTGDPVMFFMDEAWKLFQDDTFSAFIEDKMKTIRKLNGIVGLGTQSGADIFKAKIANTLIEQSATMLHFPNPRADRKSYIEGLGLTNKEFRFLTETAPEARMFLIKHGQDSVIAKLDLGGMPEVVKVLSGTKTNIEILDKVWAERGYAPSAWLADFCGWEKLPWE